MGGVIEITWHDLAGDGTFEVVEMRLCLYMSSLLDQKVVVGHL